jgi:thioredoxin reductase (NADPH)
MIESDVAIVGAGPIGLEMAIALKRAGVKYIQFDAEQVGYTVSWFAPQTRFFSSNERIAIAGVPLMTADQSKSTREEYLAYLRRVVIEFDLAVNTYEPVARIERSSGKFILTTRPPKSEQQYRVNKVILATGGTAKPRRLNVPGENLPHVDHYFRDPHLYFRKRVLIVGGKNSAVEAALRCYNAGADVSLSYRREKFNDKSIKYWLLPEITGLIEAGKIKGYFQTLPTAITPAHVSLKHATGQAFDVPTDFVLALIGYQADMTLCQNAGVELRGDSGAPVHDETTMETNVPGIYVAGTAVGGTQERYVLFIENCHVHVSRILASLTGRAAVQTPISAEVVARPES